MTSDKLVECFVNYQRRDSVMSVGTLGEIIAESVLTLVDESD